MTQPSMLTLAKTGEGSRPRRSWVLRLQAVGASIPRTEPLRCRGGAPAVRLIQ
jgi:hypothetical protein